MDSGAWKGSSDPLCSRGRSGNCCGFLATWGWTNLVACGEIGEHRGEAGVNARPIETVRGNAGRPERALNSEPLRGFGSLSPSAGSWGSLYHCRNRNHGRERWGDCSQPSLHVALGRLAQLHWGCSATPRSFSEMKTRKTVAIEVKVNVAMCLWALAWFGSLLLL